jgi:hypothetical protein
MMRRNFPGTVLHLADLRRVVTTAYSYRRQGNPGRLLLSREMRAILASTSLSLERNIVEILEKSIAKSRLMTVEVCENGDLLVVDGEKRDIVGPSRCQGGYARSWGLPCSISLWHIGISSTHSPLPWCILVGL